MNMFKEIQDAICLINEEVYEQIENDDWPFLTFCSTGFSCEVTCLGDTIFCDEADQREYIEEEYEPIEGFLRRMISKKISQISKIKVGCEKIKMSQPTKEDRE